MIFNESFPSSLTVIKREILTSTNTYIKDNLRPFRDKLPLMVLADEQTGGRGRETRQWFSAKGLGLYSSFAFAVKEKKTLPFLALTAGLAVIDTLGQRGIPHSRLQLKWPNDVLCDQKKIAGILIENIIQAEVITSICGIGVNINHDSHDFPIELAGRATSFSLATKKKMLPHQLAPLLADHLFHWLNILSLNKTAAIVKKCNHYSRFMRNKEIVLCHQNKSIRGMFLGIDTDGSLLIKGEGGKKNCYFSGEILQLPANPD